MKLRDYQERAIAEVRVAYQTARSVLLVVPTGGGKTVIGTTIAERAIARGGRVLWLAGRRELVDQAAERAPGDPRVVMADAHRGPVDSPIAVSCLPTLLASGERPPATLIIYDEAHHTMAAGSRQLLADYPRAHLLGLTATPQRGDGQALGDIFAALVHGPGPDELVERGYLCPCEAISPEAPSNTLAMPIVEAWQTYSEGRAGFVFTKTVRESQEAARALCALGVAAEHVDGATPTKARAAAVRRFRGGLCDVLCSVGVFTEGFDAPRAKVALLARPVGSVGLFLQIAGRVLRPVGPLIGPGGERLVSRSNTATLIDLCGSVQEFGLPTVARRWTLEGDGVAPPARTALKPTVRCEACQAIQAPGDLCIRCGAVLPAPEPVKVKPAKMRPSDDWVAMLAKFGTDEERARTLARMEAQARQRGESLRSVGRRYKDLFGAWPSGDFWSRVRAQDRLRMRG